MLLMRSKGMIISYMFWFWPLKRPGRKGNPRKREFPQPQCSKLNAQIVSRRINARLVVLMSTQLCRLRQLLCPVSCTVVHRPVLSDLIKSLSTC